MNRHGMSEDLTLMKTLMGSSKMFQWLWLKVLQSWFCVGGLVAQLCPTLCDPMDCRNPKLPLSMGFSRQEYWSWFPFPSPGDLPDPGK